MQDSNLKSKIGNLKIALLPLDRTRGFARDVETDAVDAFDFVADAR